MADFGDYKNNPLWTDITNLDHLTPQPGFNYQWNRESGRWEPDQTNLYLDQSNYYLSGLYENGLTANDTTTHNWLSGISGLLSNEIKIGVDLDHDTETHRLLSGISGVLDNIEIGVDLDADTETHRILSGISGVLESTSETDSSDTETHRILSGISGVLSNEIKIGVDLDHDTETHRLLSGLSGVLDNIEIGVDLDADTETHRLLSGISGAIAADSSAITTLSGSRGQSQPWKLRTKTVNQKIDEDFILLESIPDEIRFGVLSGTCYGTDRSLMDDIYGTHFSNARTNPSMLETGHPDYFIHAEYIDTGRCVEAVDVFHTDTSFGMRQENSGASNINSYELEDYNNLYDRGLADSITIFNEAPYPLQFHTADRRYHHSDGLITETNDLIYLDSDIAVTIKNDEAGRVYVKRPHTISGYTVKYAVTYKVTGDENDSIA